MVDLCTTDNAMYFKGSPVPSPQELSDAWYKSKVFASYIQPRLDDTTYHDHHPEGNKNFIHAYGADMFSMIWINMLRFWKFTFRGKFFLAQRFSMATGLSLMIGQIFYKEDNPQYLISGFYILPMLWGLANWDMMDFHLSRRQLFYKQADSRFFSVLNYAIAEWLAELPMTLVLGCIWVPGSFFLMDLSFDNFGYFWLFYLGITFYFHSLLRFITAVAPVHAACDGLAMGFFCLSFTLSTYLVEEKFEKYFGYLARCEGKICI